MEKRYLNLLVGQVQPSSFEAFFDAMNKGKEMPHTSLDEAVLSHEIIFAADLSAAKGRPVKISEIRRTGR